MRHLLRRAGWSSWLAFIGPGLAALSPDGGIAQSPPSWTQALPANVPGTIALQGMAYDTQRARTVMFSGQRYLYAGPLLNETWEWDGNNWSSVAVAIAPPPRAHTGMAYDAVRSLVVMFGGSGVAGFRFGDTWEYDGSNWTQRLPAQSPSPRLGPALTYDSARSRTVLFGGSDNFGNPHNDTWEWDGSNWTQRFPAHSPSPRDQAAMAFDPVRGRTVLFGGWQNPGLSGETWEWDGTDWTQSITTSAPPASVNGGMVWHSGIQRIVMVRRDACDVWVWDGVGWRSRCSATAPPPRGVCCASYHAGTDRLLIFGGHVTTGPTNTYNDTWLFDVGSPMANVTSFGTGCPGSLGVPNLQSLTPPFVGFTWDTQLTSIPPGLALLAFGFSNTQWGPLPLPFPLSLFGLGSACIGYTSVDVLEVVQHTGTANYSLPIPCVPQLYGFQLYQQGFALDLTLTTPMMLSASNALQVTVGG